MRENTRFRKEIDQAAALESGLHCTNTRGPKVQISSRRFFLWTAAGAGASVANAASKNQPETVYRFSTPEFEGRMTVEFFDRYSAKGFWFRDRLTNHHFCLSGKGDEGQNCLPRFTGSIAIALYHLRAYSHSAGAIKMREYVRTIDQDSRLNPRPPFEKILALDGETASDIQAFGYDPEQPAAPEKPPSPWALMRQDLYFGEQPDPFLIVHWKHTLNAITLIDVIPGERTQLISS